MARSTITRRSSRSSSNESGPTGPCRRPTSSRARRSTGTGGRPTRCARCSRRSRRPGSSRSRRREGNRRVYDLTERLFPAELLARQVPADEQLRHKLLSRLSRQRAARRDGRIHAVGGPRQGARAAARAPGAGRGRRDHAGRGRGPPGSRGSWSPTSCPCWTRPRRRSPLESGIDGPARPGGCEPGAAFLAPLDPLVWDRDLLERLFGFEYRWEVYVPAPKRRWGYYVLPLLYGDRFVGRIEPRVDRASGTLRVARPVVGGGLRSARRRPTRGSPRPSPRPCARMPTSRGVAKVALPREARHRMFVREVRERL